MLPYKSEDRSILLPYYRRYLVDPLLPYLPRRLHPNSITHAGHLVNLVGVLLLLAVRPQRGGLLFLAAATVQFYMWCDNADGAHARRTQQSSAYGEFLDHGLDLLNVLYIAYLTALGLGVSGMWWVLIVLIIPGGGAVTQWEQSQTGVYRLGLLNQIEAVTVLAGALCLSGLLGTAVWHQLGVTLPLVGRVDLQLAILTWSVSTLLFGKLRALLRVAQQKGVRAALSVVPLFLCGAGVILATNRAILSTLQAVTLATAVYLFFGMRLLRNRICAERPQVEALLLLCLLALFGMLAAMVSGHPIPESGTALLTAGLCALLGLGALADVRRAVTQLALGNE